MTTKGNKVGSQIADGATIKYDNAGTVGDAKVDASGLKANEKLVSGSDKDGKTIYMVETTATDGKNLTFQRLQPSLQVLAAQLIP